MISQNQSHYNKNTNILQYYCFCVDFLTFNTFKSISLVVIQFHLTRAHGRNGLKKFQFIRIPIKYSFSSKCRNLKFRFKPISLSLIELHCYDNGLGKSNMDQQQSNNCCDTNRQSIEIMIK